VIKKGRVIIILFRLLNLFSPPLIRRGRGKVCLILLYKGKE